MVLSPLRTYRWLANMLFPNFFFLISYVHIPQYYLCSPVSLNFDLCSFVPLNKCSLAPIPQAQVRETLYLPGNTKRKKTSYRRRINVDTTLFQHNVFAGLNPTLISFDAVSAPPRCIVPEVAAISVGNVTWVAVIPGIGILLLLVLKLMVPRPYYNFNSRFLCRIILKLEI